MTITITGAQTLIPLGKASAFGQLQVEPERFPEHVQRYIYDYGLRQILNDAAADKYEDDENGPKGKMVGPDGKPVLRPLETIRAMAEKRLAAMYEGTLRARGEAREPADPVEAELEALVKAALHEVYKKSGAYAGLPKGTKNRMLTTFNARRAVRHQTPVADDTAMVDAFLADRPDAERFRERAARNVRERAEDAAAA